MNRPRASVSMKLLGWLLIVTAVGTLLYWLDFFLAGTVDVVNDDWYLTFQRAFPAADAWMAACALIAGAGFLCGPKTPLSAGARRAEGDGDGVLRMPRTYPPWASRFSLLAGSSMVFLALLDITFNLGNGLYAYVSSSPEMGTEAVINLWSLSVGSIAIIVGWRG